MVEVTNYKALLSGQYWNGYEVTGRGAFITYSFPTTLPGYLKEDYGSAGFKKLSTKIQAAAEAALQEWAQVCGVTFLKVAPGEGDITFGSYDFAKLLDNSDAAAFAYYPDILEDAYWLDSVHYATESMGEAGDVFIDYEALTYSAKDLTHVLLHEIGHAIGLKHSFDEEIGHDEVLTEELDTTKHTVMSYTGYDPKLQHLDIDAAQHIYGNASADGKHLSSWSWDEVSRTLTQVGRSSNDRIIGVSTTDVVDGGKGADMLSAMAGDDRIVGGSGGDQLFGGKGDDWILPGSGTDWVFGGDGVDTVSYEDADSAVKVVFFLSGPTNRGFAKGDEYWDIENIVGSDYDDVLQIGPMYNQRNFLIGGRGADKMIGYQLDDNASYETATSGVIANLVDPSQNTGDAKGDSYSRIDGLKGSAHSDKLTGDKTANRLWGDGGNDTLIGGKGGDKLYGGDGHDKAAYSNAAGGVIASLLDSRINTGDAKRDQYSSIEKLTGSAFADRLYGDKGGNQLSGGDGDDYLKAYQGNDMLIGGDGADTFAFSTKLDASTNIDTVSDFEVGVDEIQIARDIFSMAGIRKGQLADDAFWASKSGKAHDETDRIIYNKATGGLSYDPDGDGDAAATRFATLDAGLALSAGDFRLA